MSAAWLAVALSPIVGSLLGLLVVRLPAGEGVVLGRSRCRSCLRSLRPLDLVPLASWLALRGRCRACGQRISRLYPAVELAAVLVAVWTALAVPGVVVWATAVLGWTLLALAVIDVRTLTLPDVLTLPLAGCGLAVAWWLDDVSLGGHAIGPAAGWLGFWLIARLYQTLRHRPGLGEGDAKLMAAAGAWVGWQGLPSVILIAALAALGAVAVAKVLCRPLDAATPIPFGPFLALGLWLTWLYGPLGIGAPAFG
ncbi:MAG: A24 family peptidase [Rhodospirillales bacterium]|nr:A24 family peptidase [Rhodospirillales bacterium]